MTSDQKLILQWFKKQKSKSLEHISNFSVICDFFFNCWAGWGYIVAFTNVMYQISYLNSPLHTLLYPHSIPVNSFNRYHFCIYIHVYTVFATYSPSYPLSWPSLPSSGAPPTPRQDLFCPPSLQFCRRKK
jgi:uncharacterized protein with PQ loop repeat